MAEDLLFQKYLEERERADKLQDTLNKLEQDGSIITINEQSKAYKLSITHLTKDEAIGKYIEQYLTYRYEIGPLKNRLRSAERYIKQLEREYKVPKTEITPKSEAEVKAESVAKRFLRMFKLKK